MEYFAEETEEVILDSEGLWWVCDLPAVLCDLALLLLVQDLAVHTHPGKTMEDAMGVGGAHLQCMLDLMYAVPVRSV